MLVASLLTMSACTQSHATTSETSAEQVAPAGEASPAAVQTADTAHGKEIYSANCAACHGASGEGGVGPPLHNERSRKNQTQTVAWIKNPEPPMPKLYPSPLSERDVDDVAAYVLSL